MAYGRGILPGDPDEVVVLQDRFWRQYFHGDPSVAYRAINLDDKPYTVVGTLPAGHRTLKASAICRTCMCPAISTTPCSRCMPGSSPA